MHSLAPRSTPPSDVPSRRIAVLLAIVVVALGASRRADAADHDPPGLDIPRGQLTGKLVRADSGEPIGRMWLTLKRGAYERSSSTDTFGRFTFDHLPPGTGYQVSFFHDGYAVRATAPQAVKAGETTQVDFKATPVEAQVAPYTYSDTYLPGENVGVMVRSIRVTAVTADIYRLPPEHIRTLLTKAVDRKTLTIPEGVKPILSFRQPVAGGHDLEWRTTRIEPAFNEPGVYAMYIGGQGVEKKLIPVVISEVALITKRTPTAVWVWATNLKTGEPLAGLEVKGEAVGAPAGLVATRKTDKRGLAKFDGKFDKNVRFWGFRGTELAYVDTIPATAAQALGFRAYVYTDRPAYRPGDDVGFKVVARGSEGGVYRVVPDDEWQVVVRDQDGEIVHQSTHQTNLFGTFAGTFKVPNKPALGDWTIEAVSGARTDAGQFRVLEYRKPEYRLDITTSKEQFVQGTPIEVRFAANYYFGAPLKGQTVTWTLYETPFVPWWYESYEGIDDADPSNGYGVAATSGTAVLDEQGRAVVKVEVDRASIDRWVTIEAVVTDETNREVTARQRVMVTRGDFRIEVKPEGRIFRVGEKAGFDITAAAFTGAPTSRKIAITASLETYSMQHKMWLYETIDTASLTTDSAGKARYDYAVKRDGFIRIEVASKDEWGNPIVESAFLWATKNDAISGGYKKKSLEILADAKSYQPGQKARILLNTERDNPWVLFTLEGDGIFEPQVLHLTGNSRLVEIPLTDAHAPNVYAAVTFAVSKQFYTLQRSISVSPAKKLLKVTVESDKRTYEPGQTAKYAVHVVDSAGAPVRCELSAALVDEAIFAVAADSTPRIDEFFYGIRPNPVQTAYSFPQRYLGGADKDGEDSGAVRKNFKDTAFWKAQFETDAQGNATLEVPLPDNLTDWRLTVRAASEATLVGGTTHAIKTSKELMASLALPRFARTGDRLEIVGMIHSRTEAMKGVRVQITAQGAATIEGANEQTFDLQGGASQAVRFPVTIAGSLALGNQATFRLTVEGGGKRDAEERVLPIRAVSVERLVAVSGSTAASTSRTFTLPEGAVAGTASLDVVANSSLAGTITAGVEALAEFPYGCAEQTMNSFLPDLVAQKALEDLDLPRSGRLSSLPEMVRAGLRSLREMQLEDGGYGWFFEGSNPYLTSYVLYGLGRAAELEWNIDAEWLTRTAQAAMALYDSADSGETAAFIAYAVAHAPDVEGVPEFLEERLPKLAARVAEFDAYSVATLVLAHHRAGKTEEAKTLAAHLAKMATPDGDGFVFPAHPQRYGWTDNPKEATGYAVRALLRTGVAPEIVEGSVRWLMSHRRGGMWDTTKDTAAVLEALAEVAAASGEMSGAYTARLTVNGAPLGDLTVDKSTIAVGAARGAIAATGLRAGENTLAISLEGQGKLYWSGALAYGDAPVRSGTALQIDRQYMRVIRTVAKDGTVSERAEAASAFDTGDTIEVRLTLQADRDYDFVAVEDLLPSGYEVMPGDAPGGFANRTNRDDRVAFFATRLGKGKTTLSYRLRAEVAGTAHSSPAIAWLMYLPDTFGSSEPGTLTTIAPMK